MEFEAVVRARRMVRRYDPDRAVPRRVLTGLLDLAARAPSAGHTQGRDLMVLREPADRERFWEVSADRPVGPGGAPDRWLVGMRTAPVLVLCLADPQRYAARYAEPDKAAARTSGADPGLTTWPIPYWDVDTGMSALLLLLGAVDAGLAACFIGVPPGRHAAVLEAFGAPRDRRLVGVVTLGHPDPEVPDRRSPSLRRGRRRLAEIAHDGRFGTPWTDAVP